MEIEIVDRNITKDIKALESVTVKYKGFLNSIVKTFNAQKEVVDERWFLTKGGALKYAEKVLDAKMQFLNLQEQQENQTKENE